VSEEAGVLTLNQVIPGRANHVDAVAAYAHPAPDNGYLRANFVASVDGAAALGGRVGALTGPADQRLLVLLRSLCDVLLVGAETVRAEGYGPVRSLPALADVRRAAGQQSAARLAVLTRNIELDLGSSAFVEAVERPIVVTTEAADPARLREAEKVADVLIAGERTVDLRLARTLLVELGLPRILSEGGPRLLAELYAADLVDELDLAISPMVTGGLESRITHGPALPVPHPVQLAAAFERDGFLFLRYVRGDGSSRFG
jgi:riboflavin biosynthesis pyrimidine reductase